MDYENMKSLAIGDCVWITGWGVFGIVEQFKDDGTIGVRGCDGRRLALSVTWFKREELRGIQVAVTEENEVVVAEGYRLGRVKVY